MDKRRGLVNKVITEKLVTFLTARQGIGIELGIFYVKYIDNMITNVAIHQLELDCVFFKQKNELFCGLLFIQMWFWTVFQYLLCTYSIIVVIMLCDEERQWILLHLHFNPFYCILHCFWRNLWFPFSSLPVCLRHEWLCDMFILFYCVLIFQHFIDVVLEQTTPFIFHYIWYCSSPLIFQFLS